MSYWSAYAETQCMACRTVLTSTAPLRPATFTETTVASGAMPLWAPADSRPSPAARPAMTVPCPCESVGLPSPDRSGPCTSRPARSRVAETPVSRTAIPTPRPLAPRVQAAAAPVLATYDGTPEAGSPRCAAVPRAPKRSPARSAVTDTTAGSAARPARPSAATVASTPSTSGRTRPGQPSTRRTAAAASAPGRARTTTSTSVAPSVGRPGSTAAACAGGGGSSDEEVPPAQALPGRARTVRSTVGASARAVHVDMGPPGLRWGVISCVTSIATSCRARVVSAGGPATGS